MVNPFPFQNRVKISAEKMGVLLDLSLCLQRALDLNSLMHETLPKVREIMDAEAVSVMLSDTPENTLQMVWMDPPSPGSEDSMKKMSIPMERSIAGAVFKTRCTEVIADARQDPRHFTQMDRVSGFDTRSILAVPLVSGTVAVGVLECVNKCHGHFDPADVELAEAVAGILCVAIEKTTLIENLKNSNIQLQTLVDLRSRQLQEAESEKERLLREVKGVSPFESIIGASDAMLKLFRHAHHALHSDITVLIQGETGTGKELLARCLHYQGLRKAGPFVAENCATIPQSLFASELFGHVKGAFSGAVKERQGLLERAHKGTLFLDEVGDMPLEIQEGLLRSIQDGCFRPVGSNEVRHSDFRLITATHKDLERMVEEGCFREDLFYRISVFRLEMPPLRERHGDIPLLTMKFVSEFNQKYGKNVTGIDADAMKCLVKWPFPGNVRELRNEIERAVAMAESGKPLLKHHLSSGFVSHACSSLPKRSQNLRQRVEALERRLILEALTSCNGNQTRAAAMLGLSRYGLAKKIQRYQLAPTLKHSQQS